MHKFNVAQIPSSRAVKRNIKHSKLKPYTVLLVIVPSLHSTIGFQIEPFLLFSIMSDNKLNRMTFLLLFIFRVWMIWLTVVFLHVSSIPSSLSLSPQRSCSMIGMHEPITALLCNLMHSYAILCYLMLSYALLCYLMHSYAILCYLMHSYAILCTLMLSYAILCTLMHSYAIVCTIMLSYALLCTPCLDFRLKNLSPLEFCYFVFLSELAYLILV